MFNNNKKQYVNILHQNKQLKLDYKTLENDNILKQEHSSFLASSETIPNDALFKLDSLQKNIPKTYITTLIETTNQAIIDSSEIDIVSYDNVQLNQGLTIAIPKNEVLTTKGYFINSGIDYIISPFSVLNEYINNNDVVNSLNILIYNDILYAIVINNLKQIVLTKTKQLTKFEDMQDDSFAVDEIVGQKVYDEVHIMEMQQFLNDIIADYYAQNEGVEFLEKIELLHTLKTLNDEQLESLHETVMVEINYEHILMEEYLDKVTQKKDSEKYSFIDPRVKKTNKNATYLWAILVFLSTAIVFGVLNYQSNNNDTNLEKSQIKQIKPKQIKKDLDKVAVQVSEKEPVVASKTVKKIPIMEKMVIVLQPNHSVKNAKMLQEIFMLFDVVPYDAVLKDLEIGKKGSTFVCNFIADTTSLADMQSKLKNIYKESKILLRHQNKAILNTIIENNIFKASEIMDEDIKGIEYERFNFLSTSNATKYLQATTLKDSVLKFVSKEKSEYLTYNYTITSVVQAPQEFFDFVEKLNKQKVSINIAYPIVFAKVNDGLEIKYNLQLHQENKKQVSLRK